nr:hypothetical protein [Tanacetum cinerariifolium]
MVSLDIVSCTMVLLDIVSCIVVSLDIVSYTMVSLDIVSCTMVSFYILRHCELHNGLVYTLDIVSCTMVLLRSQAFRRPPLPPAGHHHVAAAGKFSGEIFPAKTKKTPNHPSNLSDWAPSGSSSIDVQWSTPVDQDIRELQEECEEKDAKIKELTAFLNLAESHNSKRISELEDIIRRKNMLITMLRKDMMVLEQKTKPTAKSSEQPLRSVSPLKERSQNQQANLAVFPKSKSKEARSCSGGGNVRYGRKGCSLDLAVGFCLLRIGAWSSSLLMLFNMGARCFFLVEESESSDGLVVLSMSYIRLSLTLQEAFLS